MTPPFAIERVGPWEAFALKAEIYDLADEVAVAWPYGYDPAEIPAASAWFDGLARHGDALLVATDASGRVVGYCLCLPLPAYPALSELAAELVTNPTTTMYLAELAVVKRARRRGLAQRLVTRSLQLAPSTVTCWLVRTVANNAPALALYQASGFRLLATRQVRDEREFVFLSRRAVTRP